MKNVQNIITIVAAILIIAAIFYGGLQTGKYFYSTPITLMDTYTHTDTVWRDTTIYKPVPYKVTVRDTVQLPLTSTDSTEALHNYFTEKLYNFPLKFGNISFKVAKNDIFDLYVRNISTNTVTFIKPKYLFGGGVSLGYFITSPYVSFDGCYIKGNHLFNASITYPLGIRIGYKFMIIKY